MKNALCAPAELQIARGVAKKCSLGIQKIRSILASLASAPAFIAFMASRAPSRRLNRCGCSCCCGGVAEPECTEDAATDVRFPSARLLCRAVGGSSCGCGCCCCCCCCCCFVCVTGITKQKFGCRHPSDYSCTVPPWVRLKAKCNLCRTLLGNHRVFHEHPTDCMVWIPVLRVLRQKWREWLRCTAAVVFILILLYPAAIRWAAPS